MNTKLENTIEKLYPDTKEYDLICSLGANCSVSSELKRRGLRQVALPFDWTWFNSERSVNSLAEGFQTCFANFMQIEKLRKLENDEYSSWHSDRYQYEDLNTGFRYFNHFYRTENEDAEKLRVIELFRKRCKRFDYFLKNSKKVLLILSVICDIDTDCVKNLYRVVQELYPNCEINIHFQAFDCEKDEIQTFDNLIVIKYKRKENVYDYTNTNWEWRFLDKLKLSELFFKNREKNMPPQLSVKSPHPEVKIIKFWRIKKGIGFALFPNINTLLYFKLYLFGLRIHFSIGKNRIE